MDVSRTSRIAAIAFGFAVFVSLALAQPDHSNYDPAAQQRPAKPPDGFVNFSLKRINRSDKDYGQCLDEGRTMLLDETIKSGYFWSNLTALGLLGCLFIIIVLQHRVQTKREWTAAEMLGQLEQSLARANAQVEEATKRNRALTNSLAALKQSTPQSQPLPADTVDRTTFRPTPRHTASTQVSATTAPKGNGAKPAVDRPGDAAAAPNPGGQIALFKPEVELVTKVNVLEQQLGRSHELEKHLRRQLNETGRKLQAEQERNRSLKGE
jgi:hypothetical protein